MRKTQIVGILLLAALLVLGACAPPTTPSPTPAQLQEMELKYDDGVADSLAFAGPNGGHLIHFEPPNVPFVIKKVKVSGIVAGTGWEENKFEVQIWGTNHEVLWSEKFPFSRFPEGRVKGGQWRETIRWVEIEVPDVKVTDEFYIHVWTDSVFRPEPFGIGLGMDQSSINKNCEQTMGYEINWTLPSRKERANWMIRVIGVAG